MTLLLPITALALMAVCAASDLRSGRMPNWLTLGGLAVGFGLRWLLGDQAGLVVAAVGMVAVGIIPLGLFFFTRGRAIGGGDVKALGALGALLGPVQGLEAEMLAFVTLAVYALTREFVRGRGVALLRRSVALVVPAWRVASVEAGQDGAAAQLLEVRFGPALFVGTLLVCWAALSGGAG